MLFDAGRYGEEVASILALDGGGFRLMPLAEGRCSSEAARERLRKVSARVLLPQARAPEAALSGLWLYFSCLEESHALSQQIPTAEGSFWHGIMHRQEPDPSNAAYWFRRVGAHPVFVPLAEQAATLASQFPNASFSVNARWDPFRFIDFCEQARRHPGSAAEQLALQIQRAEWQLLFDYCASPAK
ncbi:MAG: hypothetical protein NZV14_15390 [Bryobacteraceae bacterium]|nr:hypothetical protein [Bryobacteraceae bacterium]MDW8379546.1 hypothetical protein [Bryobacterales bacterium]